MLVAKGHHSFFESMILLNESVQVIPQQITESESYQQFKESKQGRVLLQGINDDLEDEVECEHLLSLGIGKT